MDYKLTFHLIVSIAIISFIRSTAFSVHDIGHDVNSVPEYVPNKIIVKFSESIANTIENQLDMQVLTDRLTLSQGLDELNTKYRIQKVREKHPDQLGRKIRRILTLHHY